MKKKKRGSSTWRQLGLPVSPTLYYLGMMMVDVTTAAPFQAGLGSERLRTDMTRVRVFSFQGHEDTRTICGQIIMMEMEERRHHRPPWSVTLTHFAIIVQFPTPFPPSLRDYPSHLSTRSKTLTKISKFASSMIHFVRRHGTVIHVYSFLWKSSGKTRTPRPAGTTTVAVLLVAL